MTSLQYSGSQNSDQTIRDVELKVVLGIDPGTITTGWAVIGSAEGHAMELWSGHIKTESRDSGPDNMGRRLHYIKERLDKVFLLHPDIESVAFEGGFIGKQPQANMAIGYARGLAMLAAAEHGLKHYQYAPATVKKTVTNHGQATKSMLTRSIASMFQIEPSIQEDESDAIGVALCHAIKIGDVSWMG